MTTETTSRPYDRILHDDNGSGTLEDHVSHVMNYITHVGFSMSNPGSPRIADSASKNNVLALVLQASKFARVFEKSYNARAPPVDSYLAKPNGMTRCALELSASVLKSIKTARKVERTVWSSMVLSVSPSASSGLSLASLFGRFAGMSFVENLTLWGEFCTGNCDWYIVSGELLRKPTNCRTATVIGEVDNSGYGDNRSVYFLVLGSCRRPAASRSKNSPHCFEPYQLPDTCAPDMELLQRSQLGYSHLMGLVREALDCPILTRDRFEKEIQIDDSPKEYESYLQAVSPARILRAWISLVSRDCYVIPRSLVSSVCTDEANGLNDIQVNVDDSAVPQTELKSIDLSETSAETKSRLEAFLSTDWVHGSRALGSNAELDPVDPSQWTLKWTTEGQTVSTIRAESLLWSGAVIGYSFKTGHFGFYYRDSREAGERVLGWDFFPRQSELRVQEEPTEFPLEPEPQGERPSRPEVEPGTEPADEVRAHSDDEEAEKSNEAEGQSA